MAAPAPTMAAPSTVVFLSDGRELMGNAEKDHFCCSEQFFGFQIFIRILT
jgi:hypothetical protein